MEGLVAYGSVSHSGHFILLNKWVLLEVMNYFCFFPLQIYMTHRDLYTVEANNARQLVEIAARDIEKLLSNRSKALVVSADWIFLLFIPHF